MQLQLASRKKAKIKLGLSSVSGGGKTFSSILIAKGLCNDLSKVAIIDTENNSADLYAHLGNYQVLPLIAPFTPERYIEAISICEKAGMEVIIIDSISHEWEGKGGVLELSDQLGGQYQSAWKTLTPRHESFKQAIVQSPRHIITTTRRKQDYVLQEKQNKNGKMVQTPVKAGFKEVTREGWEYELTVNLELELNHFATASKDRTGLFMGKPPFIPDENTGKLILDWCNSGIEPMSIEEQIEANTEEIIKRVEACKTVSELIGLYKLYPKYQESLLHQFTAKRQLLENKNITNTQNINNNGTPINK
jgi:hypothetical protein